MKILDGLNDKQKEAVLYNEGSLLVLAGAGSGKTRLLTYKIAYLIKEKKVDPFNILAVTFTNKAANEMKERIRNLIGDEANTLLASTFHSLGALILRRDIEKLGFSKNFTILDSEDSKSLIKKILKEMNLDSKHYSPNLIKERISSAKNEMVSPNEYKKFVNTEFEEIIYKVYKKYEEKLKKTNSVDFDDLLLLPIKLFKKEKELLNYYQNRFQYILVDEYQDTNNAQYLLVKMLGAKHKNICVAGDNDQSIYSWRGANYHNILNFEKDYENVKVVMLEQNYRSTKTILNAANSLIKHNKLRKDKNLWTENEEGEKIIYHSAYDGIDEAKYVMREIKNLLDKGVDPDEIAVLYRTNSQSRILEEEALKANLEYKIIGNVEFYQRKEIKDLLAYLKLVINPKDDTSLLRVINEPKRGIGKNMIDLLVKKAENENKSIYEVLDKTKAEDFKNLIEKLRKKQGKINLTEFIDYVLNETGMKEFYEKEKTLEAERRLENLMEFKSITAVYEEETGNTSLEDFLIEKSLMIETNETKETKKGINFMTMHSAKGLEFDYVFIIGLEEGLFPHSNSLYEDAELEEERRLFYVALTRARKRAYLVNARERIRFGDWQVNLPSRFISEIDSTYLLGTNIPEKKLEKEKMYHDEEISYKIGEHVRHEKWGKGVIINIEDNILTIAFPAPFGIKKVVGTHKSITKI